MKEIKFRAWNERMKIMAQPCYCEIYRDGSWGAGPVGSSNYTWDSDGNITLMQCTGFKDNNHKEIYEGDFISNTQITFKVFWDKSLGAFRCRRDGSPDKYLHELPIETKYWVSGNIYETSELLIKELNK